jgi:hypothetical protein
MKLAFQKGRILPNIHHRVNSFDPILFCWYGRLCGRNLSSGMLKPDTGFAAIVGMPVFSGELI